MKIEFEVEIPIGGIIYLVYNKDFCHKTRIIEAEVTNFVIGKNSVSYGFHLPRDERECLWFPIQSLGHNCFASREEAEKALIISSFNISTVITHSSPKFAPPLSKEGIENYIANDINLISDINRERETLTEIYNHIIKYNKLTNWIYGHFHYHDTMYSIDNVEFKLLDMFRTKYNTWDIIPIKSK